jgi:hypothetical protein
MGEFRARPAAFLAIAASIAVIAIAPSTAAAIRPGTVVQRPEIPQPLHTHGVEETYVRIYKPLPDSVGPHPKRCDWIGYLRFRDQDGPRNPAHADAVFMSMPGIFAGATMHDQVARNIVRRAADQGKHVEYWALDRRANCLEDPRGIRTAVKARDPRVAFDYYWGDRKVHGHSFAGFRSESDAQFLDHVGLARTVRDEYVVLRTGIPNRRVRARKVLCGGHSLGGPLTTAFVDWDLDGKAETKHDAGFRQCAGFFGQDTTLGFSGGQSGLGAEVGLANASSGSPFINAPPFTPETIEVIDPIGVGAYYQPDGSDLINEIPHSANIDFSQRFLFSRNLQNFITDDPDIRDFRLQNELVLGGIFDDNSSPISILRTSVGTVVGGPVAQKDFPTPSDMGMFGLTPTLVNNDFTMVPTEPHGPLYRWLSYDRMSRAPKQVNDAGQRFSSGRSEVADIHQLARQLLSTPANWAEQYFPTRIVTDVSAAESGDRSGDLSHLIYDGVAKRPAFLVDAGDSDANTGAKPAKGAPPDPPNDLELSGGVTLPGYNHIDVVNAAWRQRGGRPEPASRDLLGFGLAVVDARGGRR